MGYCTVTEVLDMMKDDLVAAVLTDDYVEKDEAKEKIAPMAEEAIQDASAEIDGYLAKRYNVPLKEIPAAIRKFSKDIAIYNLVSRIGIDENDRQKTILTRYNQAVSFLTKAANGTIQLGLSENDLQSQAATGFQISGNTRLFSRDSLRGW